MAFTLLVQGYVIPCMKSSLKKIFGHHSNLIKRYEVRLIRNNQRHSGLQLIMAMRISNIAHTIKLFKFENIPKFSLETNQLKLEKAANPAFMIERFK